MQQQQQRGAAPAALRRPRASPQPPPRPAHAAGARGRAARSAAASTSAPQQPAPPPAPPPPTAAAARWRRPAAGALAGLCATALLARAGPAFAAAASSAASAPLPGPASGPLYSAAWLLLQLLLVGAALRAGFAARAFVRARTADALAKFKAQWRGALFIPVVAAVVGYVTNWIAVQMIFYPISFVGLPLKQYVLGTIYGCDVLSPLGWVGWQGIVPAKAAAMALNIVSMVTDKLIDVQAVFYRLDPNQVAKLLAPEVPSLAAGLAADAGAPAWAVALASARLGAGALPGHLVALVDSLTHDYLAGLCRALQAGVHGVLDLKELVVTAMVQDRRLIVELFQKCGEKELAFLVDSGLWFGFLLGLFQMAVWLFYDSPWTLTAGGAVVGYITNWAALKCIFEPVVPVRVGPFVFQGLFLTRQKEVSAEFADFFVDRVLTSRRMWATMLEGRKAGAFRALLAEHTCASFGPRAAAALAAGTPLLPADASPAAAEAAAAACVAACDRIAARLPDHLEALHPYVDSTLALRGTIKAALERMSPAEFERVLHPIFEEDEMTLILAGAVLGAIAGYIQQVTTTAPPPPPPPPPAAATEVVAAGGAAAPA